MTRRIRGPSVTPSGRNHVLKGTAALLNDVFLCWMLGDSWGVVRPGRAAPHNHAGVQAPAAAFPGVRWLGASSAVAMGLCRSWQFGLAW